LATAQLKVTMMRIPYRQRRLLRRIDRALCRSDPELASMLSMFSRLNAEERMPPWEQFRIPPEASSWYMMPWPLASAFLAIWAAAVSRSAGAGRPAGLHLETSKR
jgi:hypothetical protein